ncbi:Detected protein of unknown function [Hibiscus syriacus]|uniref:Kinesin motor domain-containing protein n=1 Tax=Hibiscus syriacus TaxID=106335 RepID=A0A6A3BI19_HIBSY|nr:Detected protein of unknown function [Hibiscus syriacus]
MVVMDGRDEEMQERIGCEERIFVSVRLWPLNEKEIDRHDASDWECISDNTIIYRNSLSVSEKSMYPTAYTFATIFAYGQTSSGKTYTMTGITEYAMADIYDYVQRRGMVVDKLTEETLRDWNHFKELLSICEAQRQIGETALNETSSRSHQILRVTVESSAQEVLLLATDQEPSWPPCKGKSGHIPYRDSKLTRILRSSLGGNVRTVIICTMSPARTHVELSRNTLLFASCAKEVTTNGQVNLVLSNKALVKQVQREMARLENELRIARTKPTSSISDALLREKDLEIKKWSRGYDKRLTMEVLEMKNSENSQYPKLRVRGKDSLDSANSIIVRPVMSAGVRSRCPSDIQSFSSEENFLQLPDFKLTIPRSSASSPQLSPRCPFFIGSTLCQEENNDENSVAPCKEVRCIDPNSTISGVIEVDIEDTSKQESKSSHLNENIVLAPHEKAYLCKLKEEPYGCRSLRFTRSCEASLMTVSQWIEKVQENHGVSPVQNAKDFTERPYSFHRKSSALKFFDYKSEAGEVIRNGSPLESQSSFTSAAGWSVQTPENQISTDFHTSTGGAEEMSSNHKYENQHGDSLALNATPETCGSSSAWPSEFNRLQRERIELWRDCNVSLVHRTYFFPLFKGDPKDYIYMEVEHRRLSFMKNAFTNGHKTVENGSLHALQGVYIEKALRRERQLACQWISKKLSKVEIENLFRKWRIELNAKQRRLKLVNLLWSDCNDMEHIAESAAIVAKLAGFENPEKTFKEMFGLNFTLGQHAPTRHNTSKRSVLPML